MCERVPGLGGSKCKVRGNTHGLVPQQRKHIVHYSPSEWCHGMWQKAVECGDERAAKDYLEMYNLWVSRNQ